MVTPHYFRNPPGPATAALCFAAFWGSYSDGEDPSLHRMVLYADGARLCLREIAADITIYDCMDELSLFRGAPARLCENEQELIEAADLVFTGGASLFEAKRNRHPRVYAFPSGVDVSHFLRARSISKSPMNIAIYPDRDSATRASLTNVSNSA